MRRLSLARVSGLIVVLVLGVTAIAAVARAITPAGGTPHPRPVCASVCRYPSEGVTFTPPRSAAKLLAASPLRTDADVFAALRDRRTATPLGRPLSASRARVSLQTVTERYPTAAGVPANQPYQGWVAESTGSPIVIGQPAGSLPPRIRGICRDVAVYDLVIRAWTELFQTCPA